MLVLTLKAVLRGMVVTLLVLLAIFLVGYVIGDPARLAVPLGASEEQYQQVRESLGLNDPLGEQLIRFIEGVFTLDFGDSYWQRRPAFDVAIAHLPNTLALVGSSFAIALVVGGGLGAVAATTAHRLLDRVIGWATVAFASAPPFWVGLLLILGLAVGLGIFPTSGNSNPLSLVLPAVTLAVASTGRIAQTVRGSLLTEGQQPYARFAVAKGLSPSQILTEHTARNAGVAISTFSLWEVVRLVAGASVVVEVVFAWPGIGQLSVQAVQRQDFPLVQACVIVVAVLVVVVNTLAELIYAAVDPRLRTKSQAAIR